jgi:hypothetical protein
MRILAPTFFGMVVLMVWLYAMMDVYATDPAVTRRLSKRVWLIVVLLTAGVGAVAWLALGRPLNAGWAPGDSKVRQRTRFVGPEDRDDWNPPQHPASWPRSHPSESARWAHPAGEANRNRKNVRDSSAAKERRLMEAEAERARARPEIADDDDIGS